MRDGTSQQPGDAALLGRALRASGHRRVLQGAGGVGVICLVDRLQSCMPAKVSATLQTAVTIELIASCDQQHD